MNIDKSLIGKPPTYNAQGHPSHCSNCGNADTPDKEFYNAGSIIYTCSSCKSIIKSKY